MAVMCGLLSLARSGDTVLTLSGEAGGHPTHQTYGAAGLMGFKVHEVPFDPTRVRPHRHLLLIMASRAHSCSRIA